jgi:hypothetical protein
MLPTTKVFFLETALPKWTEIWWETPMEGSVLSFLKAEWKVSDTGSTFNLMFLTKNVIILFSYSKRNFTTGKSIIIFFFNTKSTN